MDCQGHIGHCHAWEKLKGWVKFLFNRDNILETKDSIVTFVNSAFDSGSENMVKLADRVDEYFDEIKDRIRGTELSAEMNDTTGCMGLNSNSVASQGKEPQNSATTNYTNYQGGI
jgi:hypothetical protein